MYKVANSPCSESWLRGGQGLVLIFTSSLALDKLIVLCFPRPSRIPTRKVYLPKKVFLRIELIHVNFIVHDLCRQELRNYHYCYYDIDHCIALLSNSSSSTISYSRNMYYYINTSYNGNFYLVYSVYFSKYLPCFFPPCISILSMRKPRYR